MLYFLHKIKTLAYQYHTARLNLRTKLEIVRYLPDKKKISPASQTVATARIVPKICQGQPQQCTQSAPGFFQIGSFSAEL